MCFFSGYLVLNYNVFCSMSRKIMCSKVCTKVFQSIGVIRRVSNMVPNNILHSLYYALIYSCITHAICAWGSAYSTALKRLKSLFKKSISMRNISPNRPDRFFLQYNKVNKYFISCKMFWVICDGEHLVYLIKMTGTHLLTIKKKNSLFRNTCYIERITIN